jgi:hypothetical protein
MAKQPTKPADGQNGDQQRESGGKLAPWYRQCEKCWGMYGGVGVQYGKSAQGRVVYYRCQRCGTTWKWTRDQIEGQHPLTNMGPRHPESEPLRER